MRPKISLSAWVIEHTEIQTRYLSTHCPEIDTQIARCWSPRQVQMQCHYPNYCKLINVKLNSKPAYLINPWVTWHDFHNVKHKTGLALRVLSSHQFWIVWRISHWVGKAVSCWTNTVHAVFQCQSLSNISFGVTYLYRFLKFIIYNWKNSQAYPKVV